MNKIYLVYGAEKYFIDNYIKDLKLKYKEYEIIEYNGLETNISNAIEDLNTISIFSSSNKMIVFSNSYFLTGIKCEVEHYVDELSNYISSDTENILVLSVHEDNIDKRKKIVKELEKNADVKHFEKMKEIELKKYIKDYCKINQYKIEDDALNLLIDLLNGDLNIIISELDKFFIYKIDNKYISLEDIKKGIFKIYNNNIFDLIDAIINKNIEKALYLYDDLIILNEEEIKLIVILANQFRLIYQIKEMFDGGLSEYDISKQLGVHPYRIKILNSKNITKKETLSYLKRLGELDQGIKTGIIDKKIGFKKFILEI